MKKRDFQKQPKFLVDAYTAELKARQANTHNSIEGLKIRLTLHLAEIKYAEQQLKKTSSADKIILLDTISNNRRQVKAIERYLQKKK